MSVQCKPKRCFILCEFTMKLFSAHVRQPVKVAMAQNNWPDIVLCSVEWCFSNMEFDYVLLEIGWNKTKRKIKIKKIKFEWTNSIGSIDVNQKIQIPHRYWPGTKVAVERHSTPNFSIWNNKRWILLNANLPFKAFSIDFNTQLKVSMRRTHAHGIVWCFN